MSTPIRRTRSRPTSSFEGPGQQQRNPNSTGPPTATPSISPTPTPLSEFTKTMLPRDSSETVDPEAEAEADVDAISESGQIDAGGHAQDPSEHDDGRSSSLSEIDDEASEDQLEDGPPMSSQPQENESEAETERLESSPDKFRKQKDVLLSSNYQKTTERTPTKLSMVQTTNRTTQSSFEKDDAISMNGLDKAIKDVEQPMVNVVQEQVDEDGSSYSHLLGLTVGKKRKLDEGAKDEGHTTKRTGSVKGSVSVMNDESELDNDEDDDIDNLTDEDEDDRARANGEVEIDVDADAGPSDGAANDHKEKNGRRKGNFDRESTPRTEEYREANGDNVDIEEAIEVDTKEDGVEETVEDGGELGEAEATARNEEELHKKKVAMDSLSTIERCFATFRDRLYDERLASLDHELTLLTQPSPTHPELHAMVRALDARRATKLEVEQATLYYKRKTLEVKSVAERSQIHSQYSQTVRGIREKKLEEVGEQWYQIQRDRRKWNGGIPDCAYNFPTRRSQQIAQQSSFNLEVSILSGMALHVGFPAAPEVSGARSSEIDDDLKAMGIKPNAPSRTASHHHHHHHHHHVPPPTFPAQFSAPPSRLHQTSPNHLVKGADGAPTFGVFAGWAGASGIGTSAKSSCDTA